MSTRPAHRRIGWEKCLNACIEAARCKTVELGKWDCCLFGADCVNATTGVDLAAKFRGTYSTPKQALQMFEDCGGMEELS